MFGNTAKHATEVAAGETPCSADMAIMRLSDGLSNLTVTASDTRRIATTSRVTSVGDMAQSRLSSDGVLQTGPGYGHDDTYIDRKRGVREEIGNCTHRGHRVANRLL